MKIKKIIAFFLITQIMPIMFCFFAFFIGENIVEGYFYGMVMNFFIFLMFCLFMLIGYLLDDYY